MSATPSTAAPLLVDAFERVSQVLQRAVDGLTEDQLTARLDPDANPIAWLAWHVARNQDDHIAEVAGLEQVWTRDGWAERFDLPFDNSEIGYGQSSADVGAVHASAELLLGYAAAVHEQTVRFVQAVTDTDLARVVDESWDPPVTLAVRLVSVISDNLQHAGQAAYIRGVLQRTAR
jgi:uncharacterized damage-inducible protein DinB